VDERHPLVSSMLEHVAGEIITIKVLRDGETLLPPITLSEQT
jgi:hypothetical protein